ncbi:ATP synthase F1 subunit epsilon [Dysgonomonas macrotermitis]|uniref:F-type H+-transporting ATPase subunit epsilon n=1 Tax=Dysgonomonas macrotermitis TaxID=1346286 RepID=A0A1M5G940_9BACT|nr:ATP synthase F1 subunit epsilon [Dysgonomonas macrotermitis]SHG00239.1 F-type H+-transporting ATPase subunit epsilon [Dysgonomonas macrotermitis]
MKELQLKIVSPEKIIFEGGVQFVKLPGTEGEFSLLPNHAPLISALAKGEVVYEIQRGGEAVKVPIGGGFIEVNKNIVTVCAE